jgi:hypothetical protein
MVFNVTFNNISVTSWQLRIFSVGSTKEITAACYVECKGLTTTDYVDLTWTTFAEFPGIKLYCVL